MNKTLTAIGLSKRAGKLITGFEAVCEGLSGKGFCGVILAADISEKTEKEICFFAGKYNRSVVKADFTMDESLSAVGKRTGVFLINDEGLFKAAVKHIV